MNRMPTIALSLLVLFLIVLAFPNCREQEKNFVSNCISIPGDRFSRNLPADWNTENSPEFVANLYFEVIPNRDSTAIEELRFYAVNSKGEAIQGFTALFDVSNCPVPAGVTFRHNYYAWKGRLQGPADLARITLIRLIPKISPDIRDDEVLAFDVEWTEARDQDSDFVSAGRTFPCPIYCCPGTYCPGNPAPEIQSPQIN